MLPFACLHFSNHTQLILKDYPTKPAGFVVVNSGCLRLMQSEQQPEITPNQFIFLSQEHLTTSIDCASVFEATLLLVDYEVLLNFSPASCEEQTQPSICLFDTHPFERQLLDTLVASSELSECKKEVQCYLLDALLSHTTDKYPTLLSAIQHATQISFSEKVSLYMDARLDKEQNLPMLAKHLQVSVTTVKRRLAEDGLSFTEMLKKKRIYKGATILRAGRTSVTDIASLCGFNSATHFSSAFKSIYGCTPKEFRRERRTP
ncbi:AraC family transcriptional regulator [Vibrio inusitatus NBRC 102082]|uniref:AraC family transcriptional regulator n=1 Tax=Vibrio inusitatus NBRC 102082 TaxID=1219070 RepID=A0A4Y3HVH4_9VIBR|nr:AraC family transcriptional regulator [Vibrio inusitatus]GEA50274.1 AraC family transcriptional regulator [Vibrio inusitatus NBRC 102082]